jgi:hypothetical protein
VLFLAAVENAQLLLLTSLEKTERFLVLRAMGWPRMALLKLVAWQGIQLAGGGAVCGAFVTVAVGAVLMSSWGPLLASAAAGAGAGFLAAMAAEVGVLWHLRSVSAQSSTGP